MASATTVKFTIPSEIRLVDLVHETSQRMAEVAGFGEEGALDVALAVRETVINAIRHGNREDPARSVDLVLKANGKGLTVRVRDEGDGFDPEGTSDPTLGDNRLRTSGRGLLLIRAFVDEVKFRKLEGRGMEVTLIKRARREVPASAESTGN